VIDMPLMKMLRDVTVDAILYAQDQVVLIDPPRSADVLDGAHGAEVPSASVWCEHANRLATEYGGEPPWTGCVPA